MIKAARDWIPGQQKEFAHEFEHIPYLAGGDTISGVDDVGLVRFFYRKLGVDLPEIDLDDQTRWRKYYWPLFGDVVTFDGEGATVRMGIILTAPFCTRIRASAPCRRTTISRRIVILSKAFTG